MITNAKEARELSKLCMDAAREGLVARLLETVTIAIINNPTATNLAWHFYKEDREQMLALQELGFTFDRPISDLSWKDGAKGFPLAYVISWG